jgi:predicted Zn finger-like uncharacterized protein
MQRRFNILVPLACPQCLTELVLTLDQIHEERSVRCSRCGATIILRPEFMPPPATQAPSPTTFVQT